MERSKIRTEFGEEPIKQCSIKGRKEIQATVSDL